MSTGLARIENTEGLKALLGSDRMKQSLLDVLPRHLTPERMAKMVLVAASRDDNIFKCTKESVALAVMRASELGLDCSGGTLGEGYLVPYKDQCQFIPGYRGLIALARRSGQIKAIEARVVYEKDDFDVDYGRVDRPVRHRPFLDGDAGPVKFFWARAVLNDGAQQVEVMSRSQVDRIKAGAASKSGPWSNHYDEMGRKTVLRRLCKYLPLSPEMEQAIRWSDAAERRVEVIDQPDNADVNGRTAALVDKLKGQAQDRLEASGAPAQPEPAGTATP